MNEVYSRYRENVEFLFVYIREAHAADAFSIEENRVAGINVPTPATLAERSGVARTCASSLVVEFPVIVDDMDDTTAENYLAFPDRLCIVNVDGTVGYIGYEGPLYFDVAEMEQALQSVTAHATRS